MLTLYKIKSTWIVTETATGNTSEVLDGYVTADRSYEHMTFATREEAEAVIPTLRKRSGYDSGNYSRVYSYEVEAIEYGYANMHGWSDVSPFEIIRVVSPKCIELRAMVAELDEDFKPEFVPGGFAGHCKNQEKQTYKYKSCAEGVVVKARLGKKGWKSSHGRHVLNEQPIKFYDYNF